MVSAVSLKGRKGNWSEDNTMQIQSDIEHSMSMSKVNLYSAFS